MSSRTKIYKQGEYIYIKNDEKRREYRTKCNIDIYYPRVNNESLHEKYGDKIAKMEVVTISKLGVGLQTKIKLELDDFINFSLKLLDKPSFWCMALVRRIEEQDDNFVIGCEFLSLTLDQIRTIEKYCKTIS